MPRTAAAQRVYEASEKCKTLRRRRYDNGGKFRILEGQLTRAYGIDFHDWALMYERQGGKCPICIRALAFDRMTHVDHCHTTGKVRGLLCHHCNLLLGHIRGDAPEIFRAALEYLERHAAADAS